MLQTLARNPRTITWFLTTVFYLQLVLVPVVTRANARPLPARLIAYAANTWKTNTAGREPFHRKGDKKAPEKIASPRHVQGTVTTGPTQPETQSFQSVNCNNLVDPFTGDFSYNIPLLDVGGYPVNLHYQSGVTMDQEASWVGLGWNINPGAISRNMRGLPDDFKGGEDKITKTVSVKPNRTIGGTVTSGVEIIGGPVNLGLGTSFSVFHNTYKGWGLERALHTSIGIGAGSQGSLSGGLSISNNSQNGTDISPSMGFTLGSSEVAVQGGITIGTNYNSRTGIQNLQISGEIKKSTAANKMLQYSLGMRGFGTSISFSKPSYTPTISIPFTSTGASFRLKAGLFGQGFLVNQAFQGYMSVQKVVDKTMTLPAYGYLYYEKANNDQNVLLDFNREKDVAWSENAPNIAVPIYTYDTWSISGEGTGGMFRPYRSDIGYVFDPKMSTKSKNDAIGVDLGFGSILKVGVDYNGVDAVTKNNAWTGDNQLVDVVPFRSADTTFENVYFKNPGEKTSVDKVYQQAIGGDRLMRVDLTGNHNNREVTATRNLSLFTNGRATGKVNFDGNTLRKQRDKRSQVISYLTAREAAEVGLDKVIKVYPVNSFPATSCLGGFTSIKRYDGIRQPHHLSEITVLNPDGRRYVYGVPVYNAKQVEVTMSTARQKGNNATGLVRYDGTDKSGDNNQGKDGYFNKEEMPAYSHSFLLSGILSSDYVDLTGDGVTEDDNGDAVKFNYSQPFTLGNPYKWRAPYQKDSASYNEGLKTDSRDEKGSFSYGEREVWYLNSIISKTMIATFVLDADRRDGYGVKDEEGGQGDATQKLYKLKEINLYTKADLIKNGSTARPIKTVHFEYSYELCKKNPGSLVDSSGKLTLKKVWFSYNNNEKGKRNPYQFTYNTLNPGFSQSSVDRWGNYKNPDNNPGNGQALTNADYPYTLQAGVKNWDTTNAAGNAAAWTLSEIKLPSGGKLKVTYESDDYAYVQNKRAMQFFSIAGFGSSEFSNPTAQLYPKGTPNNDYHYVFIKVTEAVNNPADITRKYLEGVTQLFFKLAVNMPGDKWGSGYELVPCYAEIERYGVATNIDATNKTIWVQVKSIKRNESPFGTAAVQFLRLNLPSKAYAFSEPGDNIDIRAVVGMLVSVASTVVNVFQEAAFESMARVKNRCREVVVDKSFVRLDNPIYKKWGGGLRVKKTEIWDNWKKMTSQKQVDANYGQTYTYTDSVMINGLKTCISSGVASYEPMIGADENPFHIPAKVYAEKVGALAPANYLYVEEPFAETFFPSPSVGYSKIRVQTIHKDKKSANGFDETEFYTTKDFPTLVEYTPIDKDSKKSYKSPISNPFFFDSRNYVTLSQGFKVELNDMNGKPKSNATYSQNDLNKPISYTYNYYRLDNNNAAQPKLSNTVAVADSVNGTIDMAGEIGREVEVMIDVREQTSQTNSINIEANMDLLWLTPPLFTAIFMMWPLFNGETNRYRAVSVLKIVNRYGILDSVIHIEKGSRVTTRNLVYDGETGDVLLSQTNNEFDDPVYNFNYPAHWAYTGMAPAYQNIGTILNGVYFRKGIMMYGNKVRVSGRYFESGDELLVYGKDTLVDPNKDHCDDTYYNFQGNAGYKKIWAVDASKGKEGQKGIYFIDRDGIPYTSDAVNVRIIRSGKRNMPGVAVGSITSMETPVRTLNSKPRFVFDTATHVIAASAARFKDLWAVDSTTYGKDTMVYSYRNMPERSYTAEAKDNYAIHDYYDGGTRALGPVPDRKYFEAYAYDDAEGSWDEHLKSWLKFDMQGIPQGALIKSAKLHLFGRQGELHQNYRNSNACYLERLKTGWPRIVVPTSTDPDILSEYFYDNDHMTIDQNNRVLLPATTHNTDVARDEDPDITAMAQAMLDQYHSTNGDVPPGIRISLLDKGSGVGKWSRLTYNAGNSFDQCSSTDADCKPYIEIKYYDPCANGSHPDSFATDPLGRISTLAVPSSKYYCKDNLVDSTICKPNINDTAVNYYRFGVLGNWRLDRAYTYYGQRAQTDPSDTTNIRTDGAIKAFEPYWAFTNNMLAPSTDTGRWVWNSEMTRFNNKGYEIENHDPLDRYNAGQYGYNQTLPVAVAQNAKSREIAFDGFEDYGYKTDTCKKCIQNRHIDLGSKANLVDTVSHTGLYSLRVNGNDAVIDTFEIGSLSEAGVLPELSMKEDSIPLIDTIVHGNGVGLTIRANAVWVGSVCERNGSNLLDSPGNINYDNDYTNNDKVPELPGICLDGGFDAMWDGYIQPRYTGTYTFYGVANDNMSVSIWKNGVKIDLTGGTLLESHTSNYEDTIATHSIVLNEGELYQIQVIWNAGNSTNWVYLAWESEGLQPQSREVIPKSQLYPEGSNIAAIKSNTVTIDTTWCVQFKNPTASHVTHKRFSPLQGQKVVVSGWVKQEVPCVSGSYDNAQIHLEFNNGGGTYFLRPSGNIIEGWQRIEDTLTIPANADSLIFSMYATSSAPVYFDDIRIHPFNANMKSFVYNPINLRLMAELDENNHAAFYEYDDEGTLIRLKKETERGIKTIKETRSALLKE